MTSTGQFRHHRLGVWLGQDLCEPILNALESSSLKPVAIAGTGPTISARADALELTLEDDVRNLCRDDIDAVLIADPGLAIDAETLATMMRETTRHACRIWTLTPRPAAYSETDQLLKAGPLPKPIPLLRDLSAMQGLRDCLDTFGRIDAIQVSMNAPPPMGTGPGRLHDALDLLQDIMGTPHSVHAAEPAEHGDARSIGRNTFVIARYPDGRVAGINASNKGGAFTRSVTAWGEGGHITWKDGRVDWTDADGRSVEHPSDTTSPRQDMPAQLVEAMQRRLDQPIINVTEDRQIDVLATLETCMLALRTGETEHVDRVRGVFDRV